ncbi:MAG: RNA polymerase sigma factor [Acidobacteriota bacterium]
MLERLWKENERTLRTVVSTVFRDETLIDDVMQEAYLRILRFGSSSRSSGEAYRFIRKVVWSTTVDLYRRRRIKKETVLSRYPPISPPPSPLATLVRIEESCLRMLVWSEIDQAIQELPPKLQVALDCYYGTESQPIQDACMELGLSYSTLRSRMLAALERIRRRLKKKGIFEPYQELRGWA